MKPSGFILKRNGLEDYFRNSCFIHFFDLPENNNACFKRRFIFQKSEKKDEVLINYCGIPLFFGTREFAIVSMLKRHLLSKPNAEFIVKKNHGEKKRSKRKNKTVN